MKKQVRTNSFRLAITAIVVFLTAFNSKAQIIENALYFDNIDDQVQAPNASALIANSNQISLSLWVRPDNTNIVFPDYDGFAGIRNNTNADFYIVHFGPRRVEARFRNSSGVAFDVIDTSIQIGQWQHYTLTYNGSELTLYRNGNIIGTTPASGTITNTTEPFFIGNLPFQTFFYWMNGQLDEVTLWNRFLSGAEVRCLSRFGADTSDIGLQLYYKFNQGTPGGINIGLTSLADEMGNINGTLTGFSLSGTVSNYVNGVATVTDITDAICPGSTYNFGTQTLTAPGIYTESYITADLCDSIVRLNLTSGINDQVTVNGSTLTSQQAGGTYQWIDCNNGNQPVSGETGQSFEPAVNGSYAVIVTSGTCTDTSACETVTTAGISDPFGTSLKVYPNPVKDQLFISLPQEMNDVQVVVTDASGRVIVDEAAKAARELNVNTANWAAGVYMVRIASGSSQAVRMITK